MIKKYYDTRYYKINDMARCLIQEKASYKILSPVARFIKSNVRGPVRIKIAEKTLDKINDITLIVGIVLCDR